MCSTSDLTGHSINAHPRAAACHIPTRPSGRYDETGSAASYTITCGSHEDGVLGTDMLKAQQARERLDLGAAYTESGRAAATRPGEPMKTDTLRRYVQALMKRHGMRQVSLYSARHSALTMLVVNG